MESYKSPHLTENYLSMSKKHQYLWLWFEEFWEGIIYQPILINGYIAFSYKLQQFFFQLQNGTYPKQLLL